MNYKIIAFDEANGSVLVRFDENMAPLSIDVPLNDTGLYITGEELDSYIKGFIPTWHMQRKAKIALGVANAPQIASLVTPEPAPTQEVFSSEVMAEFERQQFEASVVEILKKYNLVSA